MAESAVVPRMLKALKDAWENNSLGNYFTGGYYTGEPKEGSKAKRPYLSIRDLSEDTTTHTNTQVYSTVDFEVHLVADTLDIVSGDLVDQAKAGINSMAGVLDDGMSISFREDAKIVYVEELNYWRAICSFTVIIGEPRGSGE